MCSRDVALEWLRCFDLLSEAEKHCLGDCDVDNFRNVCNGFAAGGSGEVDALVWLNNVCLHLIAFLQTNFTWADPGLPLPAAPFPTLQAPRFPWPHEQQQKSMRLALHFIQENKPKDHPIFEWVAQEIQYYLDS